MHTSAYMYVIIHTGGIYSRCVYTSVYDNLCACVVVRCEYQPEAGWVWPHSRHQIGGLPSCLPFSGRKKKLLSKQHDEGDKELILEHLNHLVVAQFVHAHCRKTPAAKSKEDMRKLVPPGLSRKFQGTNDLMVCVCVVTLIFALVLLCMF